MKKLRFFDLYNLLAAMLISITIISCGDRGQSSIGADAQPKAYMEQKSGEKIEFVFADVMPNKQLCVYSKELDLKNMHKPFKADDLRRQTGDVVSLNKFSVDAQDLKKTFRSTGATIDSKIALYSGLFVLGGFVLSFFPPTRSAGVFINRMGISVYIFTLLFSFADHSDETLRSKEFTKDIAEELKELGRPGHPFPYEPSETTKPKKISVDDMAKAQGVVLYKFKPDDAHKKLKNSLTWLVSENAMPCPPSAKTAAVTLGVAP